MFSVFTKLLPGKTWAILGGLVVVSSTFFYIAHLRGVVEEQVTEIAGLEYALNEVVVVLNDNIKELDATKADHVVQMGVIEDGFTKYNHHSMIVKDIEARIKYVKEEDDGPVAPILTSTIRLLDEATNNSTKDEDK